MNKWLAGLCLLLFPLLAMAADSTSSALSFTPPASDYSVMFLGNLFGIVDGVLHGTGSQIMGAMFTVFNAAVLALGGIVIMYTLIVGTMNTAHEGEMLGKKWSSIWIPVRSTMGLALLIPKASGYCLMQIFVMWVIVQGVGAADKVWAAALDYLNRGGAIIQPNMTPSLSATSDGNALKDTAPIATGAAAMLAGQVCMLGLQKQLESQRTAYLAQAQDNAGPCPSNASSSSAVPTNPDDPIIKFCTTPVPDFIATFDAVGVQSATPAVQASTECGAKPPEQSTYSIEMPHFSSDVASIYSGLNGICGQIAWKSVQPIVAPCTKNPFTGAFIPRSSGDEQQLKAVAEMANISRATAIQQMYIYYSSVAETMVANNPDIAKNSIASTTTTPDYPGLATIAFGVPFLESNTICSTSTEKCTGWGSDQGKSAPLLNGSEFWNGIADYNGVMAPTINLMNQYKNHNSNNENLNFISKANTEGWMTAGSYFFDLINLNQAAMANGKKIDTLTGLEQSSVAPQKMLDLFPSAGSSAACSSSAGYAILCTLFGKDVSKITPVLAMIYNYNGSPLLEFPTIPITQFTLVIPGQAASTVYGFINNAMMIQLPGQPGIAPPQFNLPTLRVTSDMPINMTLPRVNFDRGSVWLIKDLGRTLGNTFYNDGIRVVINAMMYGINIATKAVIEGCVYVPLYIMSGIFTDAVAILTDDPSANPIVVLANMGIKYINDAANLWIQIMLLTIPTLGLFAFVVAMCMPLILGWMGVMVSIGMSTAYYVPLLPYMIFTFGVIAWLMAVIEAMVAAPIVALGITHPEGEGVMGNKGEQALMILMNVFLRPALMIIGYISAIALSYVSVWIINTGFSHVIDFIRGSNSAYTDWAGMYGFFFCILIYTTMYLAVVQQSFNLIYLLPDKVLRWIGGQSESAGAEAAKWAEEPKGQIKDAGEKSAAGGTESGKKVAGALSTAASKAKEGMSSSGGGGTEAEGGNDGPPDGPPGGGGGAGGGGTGGGGAAGATTEAATVVASTG